MYKKALFWQRITNNQTQESTVNCISRGDLSLYELIKTIIATERVDFNSTSYYHKFILLS